MKKSLIILILLVLTSCGKDPKNEQAEETLPKPTGADSIPAKERSLYIKDPSLYSPEWIADFETNNNQYKSVRIMGEYMLVDNDTAYFDTSLKLKQDYRFTAFTDTHFYQLTVKRLNYTAIEYDFSLSTNEKTVYNRKGKAHLEGLFYLRAHSFNDDQTGDLCFATEYYDKDPNGLTVDIGVDEEGMIRAIIEGIPENIAKETMNITLRQSH